MTACECLAALTRIENIFDYIFKCEIHIVKSWYCFIKSITSKCFFPFTYWTEMKIPFQVHFLPNMCKSGRRRGGGAILNTFWNFIWRELYWSNFNWWFNTINRPSDMMNQRDRNREEEKIHSLKSLNIQSKRKLFCDCADCAVWNISHWM